MIDYAKITVKAGDGGAGTGSFRHIKGKRRGKADGGDGGNGGNVYLEATLDMNTLEPYRFVKDYLAKNGQIGSSNLRRGAVGADLVLKVPVGTLVKETTDNGLKTKAEDSSQWTVDLNQEGQKVLIARGGEHGRGNAHLRDEYRRRPLRGEKGKEGEAKNLTLELKLIADVGLIGLPNAGKSTLLASLTAAKPEIADYPFTTLEPNLGVLTVGQKRLVLADIPGLIEGASEGKGLGDLFLRHIERTKILVHLIDVSTETNKWDDYETIRGELKNYSKELAGKRQLILLTKVDLATPDKINEVKVVFASKRKRVFTISALTKDGLEEFLKELVKRAK